MPDGSSVPKTPLPATVDQLDKELDGRPVLWVGAGASVAAGYPSTAALVKALVAAADDPIDGSLPFSEVVDAFVESRGEGALSEILQREIGPSRPPTALHYAIARLAGSGCFAAVVTTNYDGLLESALASEGVPYVSQHLESNATVVGEGEVRLIKLHGSREDWLHVVLSGQSYAGFGERYSFLWNQLEVLLRQRPVLFVGYSLQDPRLLEWLANLPEEAERALKPWRSLMTAEAWEEALAFPWNEAPASEVLAKGNLRALTLRDHAHLPALWAELAEKRAPRWEHLVLAVEVGATSGSTLAATLAGCAGWEPAEPFASEEERKQLAKLHQRSREWLQTDETGALTGEAAQASAALQALAVKVGERLAATLLSPEARERIATAVRAGSAGRAPLLTVRVRSAGTGSAAQRRADRLLALPWELLRIEDSFPVERGTLDLVREAAVDGLAPLGPPDRSLSVVATVAAPVDAGSFDYEEEMFLLWQALGEEGEQQRLLITDLGTLKDFRDAVERHRPPVVHFTGHGEPGLLLFEDLAARKHPVAVDALVTELRDAGPLPRLIYLSSCHGASAGEVPAPAAPATAGETPKAAKMVDVAALSETAPSSAAELHRAGFAQVVAYFGPVGDRQATRTAAAFYAALAQGKTARQALRRARRVATQPHRDGDHARYLYPLGWAQLHLYHRGPDQATALAPASAAQPVDLEARERKREFDRLDQAGGIEPVEHGIVGVQRLRFGFVGRRGPKSKALRRWRGGDRLLVIEGLGGLGKTALCTELAPLLARRLSKDGNARVLALDGRHAGVQENPIFALWQEVQKARGDEAWANKLAGLQEAGLTGETLAAALVALAELEGGLLVYLDDAESLQEKPGEGSIGKWASEELRTFWLALTTACTRHGALGLLASSRYQPELTEPTALLLLPAMPRYDMVRLLSWMPTLRHLPAADRGWLADRLDGHPRTVEYLEELARQRATALAQPGGHFSGPWRSEIVEPLLPKTTEKVNADLLLGQLWDALPPAAQEHLGRCTVLTAPAPWEAIQTLEPEPGTATTLSEAGLLSPFQQPTADHPWWAPHRLVADEARRHWTGDTRAAHRLLGEWFARQEPETPRPYWDQRAVPHLCAADRANDAWPLAQRLVLHLRDTGRYREALGWVEQVLAAHPTGTQRGLAQAVRAQLAGLAGVKIDDVEVELVEALGLVHPEERAFVLSELGSLCVRQGRLSTAAEYLQQAVDVEIEVKGEEHLDVGLWLHSLAGVLQAQGDLSGAQSKLERSLEIKALVFGTEEHPEVAASLHALAGVLQAEGDLSGARSKLERSLEIKALVFGTEDHPSVAASLHALAGVLKAQGDLSGAKAKLERSLEIQALVFGTEDHPSVAASLHELAGVLKAQGDLSGAKAKLKRSLEIKALVFGTEDHPDVSASLNELAGVLATQGDLLGAQSKLERSLAIKAKIYGTREHYLTAITEASLGSVLLRTGEIERAGELLVHAHAVLLGSLGADHPLTRQAAALLARQREAAQT